MVRGKVKWKFVFLFYIVILNVFIKSLPINTKVPSLITSDTVFSNLPVIEVTENVESPVAEQSDQIPTHSEIYNSTRQQIKQTNQTVDQEFFATEAVPTNASAISRNGTRESFVRRIRPGQQATQYAIELNYNGDSFTGRAVIDVNLEFASREDPILFHTEDLDIQSVLVGLFSQGNAMAADFNVDDGVLEISPDLVASSYIVIIEYSGRIFNYPQGLFQSDFGDISYMGMNLHPTNARRVFPCMDEPIEASTITFTFNDLPYNNIIANSQPEDNSMSEFKALQGPPHLWGMVAHNFANVVIIPTANIQLLGRSGLNQDLQASAALQFYFNTLNEWTGKPYFEIIVNQDGRMQVFALPDISTDWYALSTICIWEPHIFMETVHSIKQRKTALVKIAEAMARQWFGYVIYPETWNNQWVISGLASYTSYEIFKSYQYDPNEVDTMLLDANAIFVSDIIQESLLEDAHGTTLPLMVDGDMLQENEIREYLNGIMKIKSPAILRMLRLVLGGEDIDFVQLAARALLNNRALQTVNFLNFYDAINSEWLFSSNSGLIDDVAEFLEPWVNNRGYPLLHVWLSPGGLTVTQERFGFSSAPAINYVIPITYTTSDNPNFDNVFPIMMMDSTMSLPMSLDEEDFVLFNIQGQGYYRVNYDNSLWERIIEALNDADQRAMIHPINRATLLDDALNIARSGRLDYDIALQVVLSMELETEYVVWKAFVRNMDFLRKHLVAYVTEDEDLDQNIYLRMVQRTVIELENQLGFYPDPLSLEPVMASLTRGIVMDHACRAKYDPCIAAAVDWFYDPNSDEPVVNPNIPNDIRPAVYCTMAREGDDQAISALYGRLEIEPSHWERVVILESLACSQDENFISGLLLETIASNSPYGVEERSKIFAAVAESSYQNARIAMNFMKLYAIEIRNAYGGYQKFEEAIKVLADNMVNADLIDNFSTWVTSTISNLDDSEMLADRLRLKLLENLAWENSHIDNVYEWIDENGSSTVFVSIFLICISFVVTIFNF